MTHLSRSSSTEESDMGRGHRVITTPSLGAPRTTAQHSLSPLVILIVRARPVARPLPPLASFVLCEITALPSSFGLVSHHVVS